MASEVSHSSADPVQQLARAVWDRRPTIPTLEREDRMTLKRINNGKGHYYTDDGDKIDGVTTLISEGLPKPFLIPYAANVTASYAVDHWDQLAAEPVSERIKKLKSARFGDRDRAARRGTEVHALAERLIHGEEIDVPDDLAGHVESYVSFLDTWKPRPVLVETQVASRRWHYAGTLDAVIDLPDGRRMIMDIKTTRSGIYPETAYQLAAYANAEIYLDQDGNEQSFPELGITGALGVWVRSDGYDVHPVDISEHTYKAFLHIAYVARQTRTNRDLIGQALTVPEVAQ